MQKHHYHVIDILLQCIRQVVSLICRQLMHHWRRWNCRCRQSRTSYEKKQKQFPKQKYFQPFLRKSFSRLCIQFCLLFFPYELLLGNLKKLVTKYYKYWLKNKKLIQCERDLTNLWYPRDSWILKWPFIDLQGSIRSIIPDHITATYHSHDAMYHFENFKENGKGLQGTHYLI